MSIEFKINTYLNRYTFQVLSILKKIFIVKKIIENICKTNQEFLE